MDEKEGWCLMNKHLHKALEFCNLIDQNLNLSITNLVVIGFSIKCLFFVPEVNLPDVVVLLGAFATYAHKKVMTSKHRELDVLQDTRINECIDANKSQLDDVLTQLEQIKTDVSSVKLAQGFKPR